MSPTIYVSLLLCAAQASVQGFSINLPTHILGLYNPSAALSSKEAFIGVPVANGHGRYVLFSSSSSSDGENEEESKRNVNPYADPNYPDLEFVNYDDPEYAAGQGDDEYYDSSVSPMSTDEEIEAMREDRRRRNDEYQFQTYWTNVWGAGKVEYKGEWTVYYSSKFFPEVDDSPNNDLNDDDMPRLIQASDAPLSVISSASKEFMEADEGYDNPVDFERILHAQRLEQMMGDAELAAAGTDETEQGVLRQTYWPQQLAAKDFRGAPGIMVCGNAWTICESTPLSTEGTENDKQSPVTGPFRDYRMELGIQSDDVRFRVKFDYSVLASDVSSGLTSSLPPPLHLKTMTVCREAASVWPRSSTLSESLFRAASGAPGGLYDPPPINEQYLAQYCTVDMEGGATALFPVVIDQANVDDDGDLDNDKISWTTSLDWTAGPMRFQVDRKSYSGINLRGLRTLELSEVQGADADQYRPRDGGQNMRQ